MNITFDLLIYIALIMGAIDFALWHKRTYFYLLVCVLALFLSKLAEKWL